jgi:hypothetical protein
VVEVVVDVVDVDDVDVDDVDEVDDEEVVVVVDVLVVEVVVDVVVDVDVVVLVTQRSDVVFTVNVTQDWLDCNFSLINTKEHITMMKNGTRKILPSICDYT